MISEKKIILFGGTFDPIHLGHTAVASAARQLAGAGPSSPRCAGAGPSSPRCAGAGPSSPRCAGAGKVVFIPARRSPLKAVWPQAGDQDRLAMVALAITDNKAFEASDYELKKDGPSYTLETVRHFQGVYGNMVEICWLMGADALEDLPHWCGITELIDECNLAVMHRGGFRPPDFSKFENIWGKRRIEKLERNVVRTPLIDISSTEIRRRLAMGQDVSEMVCPEVLRYIRRHGLYGIRND